MPGRAFPCEIGSGGAIPSLPAYPIGGERPCQPFGERRQHYCDLVGGGFQTIQGSVEPSTERGVTGLAAKCLDLFSVTMFAISKEARGCGHQ